MSHGNTTRRNLLKALGVGGVAGLATGVGAAENAQRVFVHPEDGQSEAERALRDHGGRVLITYDNWEFIAGTVPTDNRGGLEGDGRVEKVEDDGTVHAIHHKDGHDGGPGGGGGDDDGGCGDHPTEDDSWGHDRIDADEVTEDGTGVGVAILDTGVDTDHCDLTVAGGTNCTGRGKGFEDKNGHGTHCAGIATADDNEIGVVGVAPDADLYGVKVLDNSGSGYWSWIACGIDWCRTNGIEILSMSLGGSGMSDAVKTAITDTYDAGHLLVAAAGNGDNDTDGECTDDDNVSQPASHPDVIAVSAMDEDDTLASYSSVGPEIELMAPGTDIRSTYKGDDYATLSGTSMACPHVSGAAAVVWADNGITLDQEDGDGSSDEGNDTVRATLKDSAEDLLDCEDGQGLLDVEKAVA